jgi:hypothetical protein
MWPGGTLNSRLSLDDLLEQMKISKEHIREDRR